MLCTRWRSPCSVVRVVLFVIALLLMDRTDALNPAADLFISAVLSRQAEFQSDLEDSRALAHEAWKQFHQTAFIQITCNKFIASDDWGTAAEMTARALVRNPDWCVFFLTPRLKEKDWAVLQPGHQSSLYRL
jgi:hypothetical protein